MNEAFTHWQDHVGDNAIAEGLSVQRQNAFPHVEARAHYDVNQNLVSAQLGEFAAAGAASAGIGGHPELDALAWGMHSFQANPYRLGWSYQSFGVWDSAPASAGPGFAAVSFGAATPGSAIPTLGGATFSGKLAGIHVSPLGVKSTAAADLLVNVDFGGRTLDLASSNTTLGAAVPAPHLDLSGTLVYSPGTNPFSGALATAGGMRGPTTGRFYGPAAQELGGVFIVGSASSGETFTGAYGAKR